MLHNVSAAVQCCAVVVGSIVPTLRPASGPVVLGTVDGSIAEAAAAAASVWNAYAVPPYPQVVFDIRAEPLQGDIVGTIALPCTQSRCSIVVDPTYPGVSNVLIHEFGHGLGLPTGARSGTGMVVDDTNHWAPQSADPSEIMTATISDAPHLAMYSLDAIFGRAHRGCDHYHRACPHHHHCRAIFGIAAPGVCSEPDPGDDMWGAGLVLFVAVFACFGCVIAVIASEPMRPAEATFWRSNVQV